jgi:adenosine deaminase
LSYEVVQQLDASVSREEYENEFKVPYDCRSLVEYIKRAQRPIQLMQTADQLRLVTLDLFKQLKADNVVYAEIRFAPLQHLQKGMTPEDVVKAVNDATAEGISLFGVEAGIILCTLRHYSEEESLQTVKLVNKFKNTLVVGFDIAADEAGFPVDNHTKAFQLAHENNIHCTAHAGEACGSESVWETLDALRPSRIGHGVRSAEDPSLLKYLKELDIHLEVCPTSNIKTGVFKFIEEHSAPKIYESGVSMSINTDGRTISDATLTGEYELMNKVFQWDAINFRHCNLEAIRHSFTNEKNKEKIKALIEKF